MLTINTNHKTNTKIRLSFLITLIILSFISCEKEELNKESNENKNVALFTSTINDFIIEFAQTRAVGTTWHEQDAIGIYAINSQQELTEESIYNDYTNIKYVNSTTGEVATYSAADNKIMLPVNNQSFNFIAYYPYTPNITEFTFPIDITVQEPREDINIMYATSEGHTWDNSNVEFEFQRVLSSVLIHLSSKEGIDLQDATITIENASTNATFNLANGEVSVGQEKNAITPTIEYDTEKNELITIATLMPGQDLSNLTINIKLANGNDYTWTPDQYILPSQVTRCYEFNLTYSDVELTSSGSTIKDGEYDRDDTVHVLKPVPKDDTEEPDEGGEPEDPIDPDEENPDPEDLGDGTQEKPYTVLQAIGAQGKDGWVEGFIVGYGIKAEESFEFVSDDFSNKWALENIVLADNLSDIDEKFMIPIQLIKDNPISSELNLNVKKDLFRRKVKILCYLRSYLNAPGGVDVKEYVLLPKEE